MSEVTTIQISQDTRMHLRDLGRKGETYDQLLQRLIEMAGRVAFFEDIDRIVETEEFVPLDNI